MRAREKHDRNTRGAMRRDNSERAAWAEKKGEGRKDKQETSRECTKRGKQRAPTKNSRREKQSRKAGRRILSSGCGHHNLGSNPRVVVY